MLSNSERSASRVFLSLTAPRNLKNTYETHVLGGAARGRDGVEPHTLASDIADICQLLSRKVRAGKYKFTSYRQLLVSKGANRAPRVLSIPTARDRIVLKSLANLIEAVFPESRGGVPQAKVTQLSRAIHTKEFDGFVRLDIENFYPSISHLAVMRILRTRIRKTEILRLIEQAIMTPTLADLAPRSAVSIDHGVPQGLPISNLLAEIAMRDIDIRFGSDSRMYYLRYVDDIVILCNASDSVMICEEVMTACSAISLTVHDPFLPGSKSRIGQMSDSVDYLGYVFSSGKVSVRPDSISKLKASLARVFTRYKYEVSKGEGNVESEQKARAECLWKLDLVITGCIFEGKRRGWLHYFSQIDDLSMLKGLDATVRNFAGRFGLGDDFRPKTFTQSFWRINSGGSGDGRYVLNFDNYTAAQMRKVLVEVFRMDGADHFSDEVAQRNFRREIKRLADKLEHDIAGVS